jgi:hypothetical protein
MPVSAPDTEEDRGQGHMAIDIKPSKRGSFTGAAKRAGRSVQGEAAAVLRDPHASPAMKKKANFARNAKKWHHRGSKRRSSRG